MFWEEERRPTPTKVLKKMVYERAKGVCALCGRKVYPFDSEIGHNRPHSKGGKLALRNALLLHPTCNRSMRTLSLKQVKNAIGLPQSSEERVNAALKKLSVAQLRFLAKEHGVKVKGGVSYDLFSETRTAPSKAKYVTAPSKVIDDKAIGRSLADMPQCTKVLAGQDLT